MRIAQICRPLAESDVVVGHDLRYREDQQLEVGIDRWCEIRSSNALASSTSAGVPPCRVQPEVSRALAATRPVLLTSGSGGVRGSFSIKHEAVIASV